MLESINSQTQPGLTFMNLLIDPRQLGLRFDDDDDDGQNTRL